jgi:recombination protein RecR
MLTQLPSLQKLVRQLQRLPYLASKNVYKVAGHLLTSNDAVVEQLCRTIMEARAAIGMCKSCCNWTEREELCAICRSDRRDKAVICVVETWHELLAIENVGEYKGLYHVLGGALCPLEGIGPDKLTIPHLINRLDGSISELIFATNPTPEGEATASYIWSKIHDKSLVCSRLASGVPTGASLEYMDRVTIGKAMQGRRPF